MQTANEYGKYVTDGKQVYPYNAFLDEMISAGKLKFCEKPSPKGATSVSVPKPSLLRSPLTIPPEERRELAIKLGVGVNELLNMSSKEFEDVMQKLENDQPIEIVDGFPQ